MAFLQARKKEMSMDGHRKIELALLEKFACSHCEKSVWARVAATHDGRLVWRHELCCPHCYEMFSTEGQQIDNEFHYSFQCESCGHEICDTSRMMPIPSVVCRFCVPQVIYEPVPTPIMIKYWRCRKNLRWITDV